jgi:tetraacyldisaccharide 4'-kinase
MSRAPAFWTRDGVLARALSPLSPLVAAATARRVARPGWRAPVPVLCCGNVSVGGTGKTPLALDLGRRLLARGHPVAFLTRGHGGRARQVTRVEPGSDPARVGDEPLLLARVAPTWIAADRAASARAAIAAGARVLVLDDGLQNPSLARDLSFLVIDGGAGFGNGRVLPAGPLREGLGAALARCQAAVVIGRDDHRVIDRLAALPILAATLVTDAAPGPVLAFAGIGRPEKFFAGLRAAGAEPIETRGFPDHHPYRRSEIEALLRRADVLGVPAVTTEKDAARLPADLRTRLTVAPARLIWENPRALEDLLDRWV